MTTQILRDNFENISITDNILSLLVLENEDFSIIYQGQVDEEELMHGYGKIFCNLFNYHGEFSEGKFNGVGKLTFNKTYILDNIGRTNDLFNDKESDLYKYFFNNLIINYEGEFIDGKISGNGRAEYYNGEFYIGELKNNKRHGLGTKYNNNGRVVFEESNWNNDLLTNNKEVTIFHDNGNVKYKGGFNGETNEGFGSLYDKENNPIYIGEFKNNKFEGKGTYFQNISTPVAVNEKKVESKIKSKLAFIKKKATNSKKILKKKKFKKITAESKSIDDIDMSSEKKKIGLISAEGMFSKGKLVEGTIYHDSGKKAFEGKLRGNQFCGKGVIYDRSGVKCFEGTFNDTVTNKDMFRYPYGEFIYQIKEGYRYINGNKTCTSTSEDGSYTTTTYKGDTEEVLSKYSFDKQGTRTGPYEVYKNKILVEKGTMRKNTFEGELLLFDIDGSPKSITIYENGYSKSTTQYWTKNKTVKYKGDLNSFGRYHGEGTLYYDHSEELIQYQGSFANSRYSGQGQLFYRNGNLQYDGHFLNGQYHGQGTSYYESTGNPEYNGNWAKGFRHGEGLLMDEAGAPVIQGNWVNGEPN